MIVFPKTQILNSTIRGLFTPQSNISWILFAKIVKGWKPLTIFTKNSIGHVRQGSKCASDIQTFERKTEQKIASCQNIESPPRIFLQSCNFLELYASATNNFRVGAREKNNNITRNSSRFYILTLLTLLSADAKSGLYLRVSSLTKVEVRNFLLLHFPDGSVWFMDNLLCLCDVWKGHM